MPANEADWVVVKRFDDAMIADVTLNFLRDHDVTAAFQGNSGATGVLTRFTTVLDIRLVVPRAELDRALEVLAAMDAPEPDAFEPPPAPDALEPASAIASGVPYRGAPPATQAEEARSHMRRYKSGPMVLAFVVPGGGHFYARHNRAGMLFCVAILTLFLGSVASGQAALLFAAMALAGFDAVLGVAAVGRYNRGQVLGDGAQTAMVAGAMVASVALGYGVLASNLGARSRHAPTPSDTRPW